MKKLILAMALIASIGSVAAQGVAVQRNELGTGTPGEQGYEAATQWSNDIYHAPQYMPGFPTAATIWPRVVEVDCLQAGTYLQCKGYNWTPDMGRAEYLMVKPRVTVLPEPKVITRTIIKEVEVKKPRE